MPDQVHCAHILVKTEQEAKAVLDRLNKGEKFSNIAKEVSQCPSGKRGGDSSFWSPERTNLCNSQNKIRLPHHKEARISSFSISFQFFFYRFDDRLRSL
jgi:hypothetical protein